MVRAARGAIELFLRSPHFTKEAASARVGHMSGRHGLFVSLFHYPTRTPRGLMGYPEPKGPLRELIVDAAIAAAFEDPNHVSVSVKELEHLVVEVDIVTGMHALGGSKAKRYSEIKPGRDGLIVEYGLRRSIILPREPVERGWTKVAFMEMACKLAGLSGGHWTQPGVKMHRFETQTFAEESPDGKILEIGHGERSGKR